MIRTYHRYENVQIKESNNFVTLNSLTLFHDNEKYFQMKRIKSMTMLKKFSNLNTENFSTISVDTLYYYTLYYILYIIYYILYILYVNSYEITL